MKDQHQFYSLVGERIREARKVRSLTQEALAMAVSLTRTSITNIEQGRQNFPLHTLIEIARALGVSSADLIPPDSEDRDVQLDQLLEDRSADEQAWIRSALGRPKETK